MKNKMIFAAFALMCLIGSMSVASASRETRLNIYPNFETGLPVISGNTITFLETMGNSIQMYDLLSGKQKQLSTDLPDSGLASISGNNIVWSQNHQIMLYNTTTRKTTSLLNNGFDPDIYRNTVVYGNSSGLYTYDLSTKKINSLGLSGESPQIYGNYIVYKNIYSIYIYNILTKKQSLVGEGGNPDIYNDIVVWNNNKNIYMRNIVTHKTTLIATNGDHVSPKIYGNNIVWCTNVDFGNIFMYSASTGKTTQITKNNLASDPAISGNRIVYLDIRNVNSQNLDERDLFVYDLTAKLAKPTGIITANVTSGTHPLTVFFSFREDGDMPTSYLWNFGDSKTSTNPWTATHTYTKKGTYTVSLKVSNSAGSSTITKTKYITVK